MSTIRILELAKELHVETGEIMTMAICPLHISGSNSMLGADRTEKGGQCNEK